MKRKRAPRRDPTTAHAGRLQWLAQALLIVGLLGLQPALMLSWLAIGLTVLAGLKLLEAKQLGERRLVGLLQMVCAGVLGALQPDLAPSLLQGLAVCLALAGLLALEAGQGPDWRMLLRRSLQVLTAALPMALALFVLAPRLAPFTPMGHLGAGIATIGLSDTLAPGTIASLAGNSSPAARVSFGGGEPRAIRERYWRVLVHDRFDGQGWQSSPVSLRARTKAGDGDTAGEPPRPTQATEQQLWTAEASGLPPVPWDGRSQPLSADLRITPLGELVHRGRPSQRRLYALSSDGGPGEDWRRAPPDPWDLQLPAGANPRLEALASDWRSMPPPKRLAAAQAWFRSQPFRYSRSPGTLPSLSPLDAFLFERQEGFCGHYASAFSALMRAAGMPARVVSGYRGGDWVQPLGGPGYLDLRQNDAHAWSEVWIKAEGWIQVDPTTWIASSRGGGLRAGTRVGGIGWLERQWWALDIAWSRWWLGFDRQGQEALLQRLLGEHRNLVGILVISAVGLGLAGAVGVLGWLRRRPGGDPPRREIERCLAALARRGFVPEAGDTLPRFTARLATSHPSLATRLEALITPYQHWRYGPGPRRPQEARNLAGQLRLQRRELERTLRREAQRPHGEARRDRPNA